MRMLMVFGLAALWAVNEWLRTWVLSGFPWLPLAASQWERASILQIAAFTGAGGVSAVLMALNLGFAAAAHRLFFERHLRGLKRRSQEFFAGMFLLIVCLSIHMQEAFNRAHFNLPLGRVGIVQPDVAQHVKWDPNHGPEILKTLEETTLTVARRRPALILWPEAVTPWAVRGDASVQAFVEDLVQRADTPLLLGSIAIEPASVPGEEAVWHNGVFQVSPTRGLEADYYRKRRLVPFGEFVPLRPVLGWLDKIVPLPGDFVAGTRVAPLLVQFGDEWLGAGPLICYEDIFPALARDSVRAGADILVVQTNNGWFGRGGAAYQHAAHSVLRAVETRRPVLRVGNAGWSGWIDEFGSVRALVQKVTRRDDSGKLVTVAGTNPDEAGTIYFRGSAVIDVTRDARWIGRESFYVKHGNWFILLAAIWGGLALWLARILPPAPPPPDPDGAEVD
jgi:apolipoprotein N-acyltransferase